jgi:hypothetical protein
MTPEPNNQPAETLPQNPPVGFVKKFLYHPNFNVVCGIVTIASLILAIVFYCNQIREPDLTYYISPTRTPIVQKGNLNNFSINFQGTQITNNLSGATIQIWNQGKAPIHKADILKAITLKTQNGEKIYQVTAKSTREVVGFNYTNNNQSGVLKLDWKVLEQGDGVLLQIIYGGNVDAPLIFDGVIEGQKNGITKYQGTQKKYYKESVLFSNFTSFFIIILSWYYWNKTFRINILKKLKGTKRSYTYTINYYLSYMLIGAIIFLICITLINCYNDIIHSYTMTKPPFGF